MPSNFLIALLLLLAHGVSAQVSGDYRTDSLAVRAILDSNGLVTVPVGAVTRVKDGRIAVLNLVGRDLATLPATIGDLQALDSLDLMNNRIRTLPATILGLKTRISVQGNRLCQVDSATTKWLDDHYYCVSQLCFHWRISQDCRPAALGARPESRQGALPFRMVQEGFDMLGRPSQAGPVEAKP